LAFHRIRFNRRFLKILEQNFPQIARESKETAKKACHFEARTFQLDGRIRLSPNFIKNNFLDTRLHPISARQANCTI
jgi:hypothetical protein